MLTLVVQNSNTFVMNSDNYTMNLIDWELRYRPDGYIFSPAYKAKKWDGWIRCFERSRGIFQTGLLNKVCKKLDSKQIKYKIQDERKEPRRKVILSKKIQLPPLRDYQKEAVDTFVENQRGVINLGTGLGKTFIAIEIISRLQLNTLFVCPNTVIMKQTAAIFEKYYGKSKVGMVYGKKKAINRPIVVACVSSLEKFEDEKFDKFDLLIVDEFHHSASKTYQKLNKKKFSNIFYRCGLTATFFRNDGSDMEMEGILSDVIYKMNAAEAIKKGYLIEPYFVLDEFFHKTNTKQWQKVYKECIVENKKRNDIIIKRAKYCMKKDLSTLILVKEIKHGELLESKIPGSVFIHGNTENREELIEKFRNREIKMVIGTSIFGEGSDVPVVSALINAQAMKAESDLIQKIGRALRLYDGKEKALIFDIFDKGQRSLERQSNQRLSVYKDNYTNKIKIISK